MISPSGATATPLSGVGRFRTMALPPPETGQMRIVVS